MNAHLELQREGGPCIVIPHLSQRRHDDTEGVDVHDLALQHAGRLLHVVRQHHEVFAGNFVQVAAKLNLPIGTLLLQLNLQVRLQSSQEHSVHRKCHVV